MTTTRPARIQDRPRLLHAGQIVGLAGWKDDRLRHVYVDPAHTRRGIATMLVRRVEADFRRRSGATRIRAGVALHAEPFYRAIGYRLVARRQAWDGSEYLEMCTAVDVSPHPAGSAEATDSVGLRGGPAMIAVRCTPRPGRG